MNPKEHHQEKAALIVASLLVGLLALIVSIAITISLGLNVVLAVIIGLVAAVIVSLTYPVFAASAIKQLVEIRAWAYKQPLEPLSDSTILILAAVWPLSLVAGGTIYIFIGIIHRVF